MKILIVNSEAEDDLIGKLNEAGIDVDILPAQLVRLTR